jgi:hypothetical protein
MFPIMITSCGIQTAMIGNINNNNTNVELSKKNFKVIRKVSGHSLATYVFLLVVFTIKH